MKVGPETLAKLIDVPDDVVERVLAALGEGWSRRDPGHFLIRIDRGSRRPPAVRLIQETTIGDRRTA